MIYKYFNGCKDLNDIHNKNKELLQEFHPKNGKNPNLTKYKNFLIEYNNLIELKSIEFPINGSYYTNAEGKQILRNKRKYTRDQTNSNTNFFNNAIKEIRDKGHKKAYLFYKYKDYIKDSNKEYTLEDLELIEKFCNYISGWAIKTLNELKK